MTHSEKMLELLEKGQLEEAKKEFGWALRKDDDQMIYSLAEELYSLGFSKQSKRAYEKLLERYPDEDGIKTALADIEISDGNDDRALELLAQIMPDSDSYLEALLVSADLYQTQGMFDVSEQKLLEARRLAPDETVILFGLAELYFNVKEYRKAARCYLDLVKSGVLEFSKSTSSADSGFHTRDLANSKRLLDIWNRFRKKNLIRTRGFSWRSSSFSKKILKMLKRISKSCATRIRIIRRFIRT